MEKLIADGNYPGIATHDPAIIEQAKKFVKEKGIPDRPLRVPDALRRSARPAGALVREGYRMRVYVPFGTQWYPYLMRRLAERPANVAFITGNVVREMMSGYKQ